MPNRRAAVVAFVSSAVAVLRAADLDSRKKKKKRKKRKRCTRMGAPCHRDGECCKPQPAFDDHSGYRYRCYLSAVDYQDNVMRCVGTGIYCDTDYECEGSYACQHGICLRDF